MISSHLKRQHQFVDKTYPEQTMSLLTKRQVKIAGNGRKSFFETKSGSIKTRKRGQYPVILKNKLGE